MKTSARRLATFRKSAFVAAAIAAFGPASAPGAPLEGVPVTGEMRVFAGSGTPEVVMDADGDFVVAGIADRGGTAGYDVVVRAYTAGGIPRTTSEVTVNSYTTGFQSQPKIAMNARGQFVVAWASTGQDGDAGGVYARAYHANGLPRTAELQVNDLTAGSQQLPQLAIAENGDFVVSWEVFQTDVFVRAFHADGTPKTASGHHVRSNNSGGERSPRLAMDRDGDFVVAYEGSTGAIFTNSDVFARPYNADGTPRRAELRVNDYTTGVQSLTALAAADDGDFAVLWQGPDGPASSSGLGVFVRAYSFDGSGRPEGEMRVNELTSGNQTGPLLAMDARGDFVVAWNSYERVFVRAYSSLGVPRSAGAVRVSNRVAFARDLALTGNGESILVYQGTATNRDIFAQTFRIGGTAKPADELRVNTYTTGTQTAARLAVAADGDFAVTWDSRDQDGSGYGVYTRSFNADGTPKPAGEQPVNVMTAGSGRLSATAMDHDGDFVVLSGIPYNGFPDFVRKFSSLESVDLGITQSDSPDPAPAFGPLSYTLNVNNLQPGGPGTAVGSATGVRVLDTLPPGSVLSGVGGAGWSCAELPGSVADCRYAGVLAAAQTSQLVLTVTAAPNAGPVTNRATVSAQQFDADETAPGSDSLSEETTTIPCTAGQGAGTFTLEAPLPASVDEGGAVLLRVRRSGCNGAASLRLRALPVTAGTGDYSPLDQTLSWANGEGGQKSVNLQTTADSLYERTEQLRVLIDQAVGATLGGASERTVTIRNDDPLPRVRFESPTAVSETEGGTPANVRILLSAPSGVDTRVPVEIVPGSTSRVQARRNIDYTAPDLVVDIPAGSTVANFRVQVIDDALGEPQEEVAFRFGPNIVNALAASPTSASKLINSNDPLPVVQFDKSRGLREEGQEFVARVLLSAPAGAEMRVFVERVGGTGSSADFSLNPPPPVIIREGATSAPIRLLAVDDALNEPQETVRLQLFRSFGTRGTNYEFVLVIPASDAPPP